MEAGAGHNRVLCAIVGAIARPNATFRTISHDPDHYLASSVAIFAAVCLVSALPLPNAWFEPDDDVFRGFDGGVGTYARSLISAVLTNLLTIAVIFWVGSRYGGNRKFRNIFPVLPYCLIPIMVGAVVTPVGTQLFEDLLAFTHDDMSGTDPGLSPSYALDFAGGTAISLIHNASAVFLGAWVFVLFVKAIKISHGFGTRKSIGVLALALLAAYALTTALGILHALFLSFFHIS